MLWDQIEAQDERAQACVEELREARTSRRGLR